MSADHVAVATQPQRWGLSIENGRLRTEAVDLTAIADAVGTPAYVYGSAFITSQFRKLEASVRQRPTLICYAVKANSSRAVLELLRRLGAGADIVSGGELARALAAGIDPKKIVFSGVGKTDEEIDAALDAGVRSINVESTSELRRIARRATARGVVAPICLRINPDVDPDTHPYLATGMQEAKFGIPMEVALQTAEQVVAEPSLRLVGLAAHIGSQIQESRPYLDSLARLRTLIDALAARGVTLSQLDLGGGHGIAYRPEDPELDVDAWGAALADATADLDLELVLEPGRYLVGNAGVLLTRVIGIKVGEKKRFAIVDAAMNDLIRPALYDAYHVIAPVEIEAARDAEVQTVDVVGPVCESGDFLALGRPMPELREGDLLAVLSAGAYGAVMAGTYNTRPEPVEVLVRGEQWAVTKPRRTVQDLLDAEQLPPWSED